MPMMPAQAEKIVAEAAGKASAILTGRKEAGKERAILERAQKEAEEQKRRILGIAQLMHARDTGSQTRID